MIAFLIGCLTGCVIGCFFGICIVCMLVVGSEDKNDER